MTDDLANKIEHHAVVRFAGLLVGMQGRLEQMLALLGVEADESDLPMDDVDRILHGLETELGLFVADELTEAFPDLDAAGCELVNDLCNDMGAMPEKVARLARYNETCEDTL